MSEDTPSITDLAHERGDDGQLLPVTETREIHGQEVELGVIPPTSGQRNEWRRRLAGEDEELSDEVMFDLLDEFAGEDPEDFNDAESWDDVRPAITDAYAGVILAKLFDAGDTDEFVEKLDQAAREVAEGNLQAAEGPQSPSEVVQAAREEEGEK